MKNIICAAIIAFLSLLASCGGSTEENFVDVVTKNDFAHAHELLKQEYNNLPTVDYRNQVDYRNLNMSICIPQSTIEAYDQYIANAKLLYREEGCKLINMDNPEAEEIFLENLSDMEIGIAAPSVVDSHKEIRIETEIRPYYELYNTLVREYNDLCFSLVKKALLKNKDDFAEKIVFLMRPEFTIHWWSDAFFEVMENTNTIQKAKALLYNHNLNNIQDDTEDTTVF